MPPDSPLTGSERPSVKAGTYTSFQKALLVRSLIEVPLRIASEKRRFSQSQTRHHVSTTRDGSAKAKEHLP